MSDFLYLNKEVFSDHPALFYMNRAGVTEGVSGDFDIARNSTYPYSVLHYVICGSGVLEYKGISYSIGPGQLFVLDAYEKHRYRTDPVKRLGLRWIEFYGGNSAELVKSFLSNQSPVLNPPVSSRINHYMIRIMNLLSRDAAGNKILVSKIIYAILAALAGLCQVDSTSCSMGTGVRGIENAIAYIHHHPGQDLSIKQLADIANFNPSYFSRLFHCLTGMTPARYVLRKRILRARELLGTSISVEQLSEELGFCNTSHFIKQFKKAEGLTPSEYRRQSLQFRNFRGDCEK